MVDLTRREQTEAIEKIERLETSVRRMRNQAAEVDETNKEGTRNLMRGAAEGTMMFAGDAFGAWVTADRKIWRTKIPVSTLPAALALALDLTGWSQDYITVGSLSRFLGQPLHVDFALWNYKKRLAWMAAKALGG